MCALRRAVAESRCDDAWLKQRIPGRATQSLNAHRLYQVSIIENMNPLITFKNGAVQKKEDFITNQSYNNYMSTSQAGGRKIHVLCNKFPKFVPSSISFAGGGRIYDLHCVHNY
ncbi:Hypothetical predicted protein [Xyrichtys novacula]|uniref:Uncharacterized protein n=1 Tax=Xyrichtys novacula TaxID=13765 RepID=A0AAV1EQD0_XYRNO|nr:Hypothetical predicted protein [Xyrichtys novacula]